MKLAWLSHTRPDCAYLISQFAQLTHQDWNENRRAIVKSINRTVTYVKSNPLSLAFPRLDLASVHIVCFSDAPFATNKDLTSHLGYICLLTDDNHSAIPIYFNSTKRVVLRAPSWLQKYLPSQMYLMHPSA